MFELFPVSNRRLEKLTDSLNKRLERKTPSLFNYIFDEFDGFDVKTHIDGNNFYIELDVPGFSKEDLDITIYDNYVQVKGEIESKRGKRSILKRFSCPEYSDVEAEVKNGLLILKFIFEEKNENVKKLEIK